VRLLGSGGFGTVAHCINKHTREHVAVKQILKNSTSNAEYEKEVNILSSLNHPNIVDYRNFTVKDGAAYIEMELC